MRLLIRPTGCGFHGVHEWKQVVSVCPKHKLAPLKTPSDRFTRTLNCAPSISPLILRVYAMPRCPPRRAEDVAGRCSPPSPDTLIRRSPNMRTIRSRASRVLRLRNTGLRSSMVGTGRKASLYSSNDARRCLPLMRRTTCGVPSVCSGTTSPACSCVSAGCGSGFGVSKIRLVA